MRKKKKEGNTKNGVDKSMKTLCSIFCWRMCCKFDAN